MKANVNKQGIFQCTPFECQDYVSIFGENYKFNNNILTGTYFTSNPNSYCTIDSTKSFNGLPALKISQSGNTSNVYRGYSQTVSGVSPGDTITVSVWLYRSADSSFDSGFEMRVYQPRTDGTTNWTGFAPSLTNWKAEEWYKVQKTYTLDSNMKSAIFSMNVVKNGEYWFAAPKVEYGNTSTPWCPNKSDSIASGFNIDSTISNAIYCNEIYEI